MKNILLVLLLLSQSVGAKEYIVLFKQTEIALASMEHGAFQEVLQQSNEKNLVELKNWISSGIWGTQVPSDLWLIRGAALSLSEKDAKRLGNQAFVDAVIESRKRLWAPSDRSLKVSEHLGDEASKQTQLWGLKRIGVDKVRREFPHLTGRGVRVGVIDSGIQSRHPELADKVVAFKDFVNGMPSPYDDQGHGTHVAGTIAGNEVGVAPGVSLVIAKALTASGYATDVDLISAMQWMFDPDGDPKTQDYPRVVSNSWGMSISNEEPLKVRDFLPFFLAVQAWVNGGIVPVFAAGNSGAPPVGFPASIPETIAVGAYGANDMPAPFSSVGPNLWIQGNALISVFKPDISAPGVQVTSSFPGNQYATWDGTSMATPHVSGAIALALQANPKMNVAELKRVLLRSSEIKKDTRYGYGMIDALALVKKSIE